MKNVTCKKCGETGLSWHKNQKGNLEEAVYYASQLGPVWGQIEVQLEEIIQQSE